MFYHFCICCAGTPLLNPGGSTTGVTYIHCPADLDGGVCALDFKESLRELITSLFYLALDGACEL